MKNFTGVPGCFGGFGFPKWSRRWSESRRPATAETNDTVKSTRSDDQEDSSAWSSYIHYGSPCDFAIDPNSQNWLESTDGPPCYSVVNKKDIYRSEVKKTIEDKIDALDGELRHLSLQIHDHPELAFQERYAHDTLTAFMENYGFAVTRHYLGLETAWRAEFKAGNGGRVLGINSEMDALPGIGHACGHNIIAIAGVGVAIGLKAALETHDIPGKIILLGTPAEESGGGKVILLERGGYEEMHACLMCHPGPGISPYVGFFPTLALQNITVEYFGQTAHAAAAPWEGINALDAAFLAYSSISVLRQQIKPDHRVHGIIEGKNWAPNIIPDYAKMRWIVRAPTWSELVVLRGRLTACFEAAAQATSCKMKTVCDEVGYYDLRQNSILAQEFTDVVGTRYGLVTKFTSDAKASTDFGNVTYALPSIHPMFTIPSPDNAGNHTPAFAEAARTIEAHRACITITKGLAITGLRVLDDDEFFKQVKNAYEDSCGTRYKCIQD